MNMKNLNVFFGINVKPFSLLFLFLLLAVFFAGCSKDETPEEETGSYFMKAKIDGQWVEFTAGDIVEGNIGPTVFNHGFGAWGSGSDRVITIVLEDKNPVVEKSYAGIEMHETYTLGVTIGFVIGEGDTPVSYVTNYNDADSRLTITRLTEKEAKGTFSGTLINPVTEAEVKLTEGSFHVKMAEVY
jgi:hypothetical protein